MKHRKSFLFAVLILLASLVITDCYGRTKQTRAKRREPIYKKTKKIEVDVRYDFTATENTSKIKLIMLVPISLPRRQRIYSVKYSPEPTRTFSKNGNDYAEFIFINPQKQFAVQMNIKAKMLRYDLSIARENAKKDFPEDIDRKEFLKSEANIEKDDPGIMQVAEKIKGDSRANIIKNIQDYVIRTLEYRNDNQCNGALYAIKNKKGQCCEYAALFVALCRAKKIPARVVTGYTTESELTPRHAWAEVYFSKYGWVPFDPTWADVKRKSAKEFHYLHSAYIYLSRIRNDEILNNNWYATIRYWGDKPDIKNSITFK